MKCVSCRGNEPTLSKSEIYQFMLQMPDWRVKAAGPVLVLQDVERETDGFLSKT